MGRKYIATLLFVTTLVLALFTFGCDTQGPAEKAGEKIDNAVESTKDAVSEVVEKKTGEGPVEEIGEKIDETAAKMKESVELKK